jgi:hypothetical protein
MNSTTRGGVWDLLVPAEFDRRAVDETLADWREDASSSRTLTSRARAHVFGGVSLVRVVIGLVWAQSHRAAAWYWCWKVLLIAGVLAAGSSWMVLGYFPFTRAAVGGSSFGVVIGAIVVFGACAPIVAASGAGRPPGEARPLLGVMTGLFLTVGMAKLIGLEIALRGLTDGFVLTVTTAQRIGLAFSALDVPMLLLFGEALRRRLAVSLAGLWVGLLAVIAATALYFGTGLLRLALRSSVPLIDTFPAFAPIASVTRVLSTTLWLSRSRKASDA